MQFSSIGLSIYTFFSPFQENEELMAKILDSVTEHAKETDQTGNKDYRDFMSKIIEIQK